MAINLVQKKNPKNKILISRVPLHRGGPYDILLDNEIKADVYLFSGAARKTIISLIQMAKQLASHICSLPFLLSSFLPSKIMILCPEVQQLSNEHDYKRHTVDAGVEN